MFRSAARPALAAALIVVIVDQVSKQIAMSAGASA